MDAEDEIFNDGIFINEEKNEKEKKSTVKIVG